MKRILPEAIHLSNTLVALIRAQARLLSVVALLVILLGLTIAGCGNDEGPAYKPMYDGKPASRIQQYIFGIAPQHNPQKLLEVFSPLIEHLNAKLAGQEVEFKLEASHSYEEYLSKLKGGTFHFALHNPYHTVFSVKHGYAIIAKYIDDGDFCGIILVRKDSDIHSVADLKGKTVSYPAPTAMAATLMPQMFLQEHGLKVMQDVRNVYVGSLESSIMSVFLGQSAAGTTWPPPWRSFQKERPDIAEKLEVKWQTEPLPNIGIVARKDVPPALVSTVADVLFGLKETPAGRKVLRQISCPGFEPATEASYEPVRRFLEKFRREVRPL